MTDTDENVTNGPRQLTVIGVASGKGGVGKTTLSAHIALALCQFGHRVALLDADLGLANAQLLLGVNAPFHVGDVLAGRKSLDEVCVAGPLGLTLIPGASGNSELANLTAAEAQGLVQSIAASTQEIDVVVIDAAAGLSESNLTFLRACDIRLVVLQDEPASIADAYGLIKLQSLESRMENLFVVPNRVSSQKAGADLFEKMNRVCMKFLDEPVGYLHSVEEDPELTKASRQRQNIFESNPHSSAAKCFTELALRLSKALSRDNIANPTQ